jgi:two-component system, cell cycle response regulator DivK
MDNSDAQPGKTSQKPGKHPLILVVDDYSDVRQMYTRFLTLSGFEVEQAAAGSEALEKCLLLQPELIILDVAMPGMDGWEVIRRLKADARTRSALVVVVTGAAYGTGLKKAKEAGCDAYLVKPCLPETLLGVVRSLLSRRQS